MFKLHDVIPKRSDNVDAKPDYKLYKDDLKKDFNGGCGYCGDDCIHFEPHIDHFRPQHPQNVNDKDLMKCFLALRNSYENLVFTCPFCNRKKGNKWPTGSFDESCMNDQGFIDPCDIEYSKQFARRGDGRIYPKTQVGSYMFKELGLGFFRHQLLWLLSRTKRMKRRLRENDILSLEQECTVGKNLDIILEELEEMLRGDS